LIRRSEVDQYRECGVRRDIARWPDISGYTADSRLDRGTESISLQVAPGISADCQNSSSKVKLQALPLQATSQTHRSEDCYGIRTHRHAHRSRLSVSTGIPDACTAKRPDYRSRADLRYDYDYRCACRASRFLACIPGSFWRSSWQLALRSVVSRFQIPQPWIFVVFWGGALDRQSAIRAIWTVEKAELLA
jgi:hypothetical protein